MSSIQYPFQLRLLGHPDDIQSIVNVSVTGLLGKPFEWERSKKTYQPTPKYKRRGSTAVRVYVNIKPTDHPRPAEWRKNRGNHFKVGQFDIEIGEAN
jgi:hypothetical protein